MASKRLHKCSADACAVQIANSKAFCEDHYRKLPADLRRMLAHNFHIGAGGAWLNNIRAGIKYLKGLEAAVKKANQYQE